MSSGPDLFVVCKSCGSEVSPYITECPYCGNRLRKRAPKLDREGQITPPKPKRSRSPSLGRFRPGELPGIRVDRPPYASLALVVAAILTSVVLKAGAFSLPDLAVVGSVDGEWWHLLTASFVYANAGYQLIALATIGLFGWLIERRDGPVVVVAIALIGGAAGMALEAFVATFPLAAGGNAMALALLAAWAVPDLLARRGGEDTDSDLIGVAVIAAVVALMPLVAPEASWLAAAGGLVAGAVLGLPRAARHRAA